MNARAITTDVLLGIVPIALLVALWQAISSFGYAPVTLLPPPGLVFMRLVQQLFTSGFQQEIGATLFRLFAGFSIAVVLGVTIGLAAAASPAVKLVNSTLYDALKAGASDIHLESTGNGLAHSLIYGDDNTNHVMANVNAMSDKLSRL